MLVPFSRTLYYLDGPEQKGIAYESLRELEKNLPLIGKSKIRPKIVIIPTTRDRLLPALAEGYGDIAIGAFTVTDRRRETVDFSVATMSGIEDVVVTQEGRARHPHGIGSRRARDPCAAFEQLLRRSRRAQ